MGSSASARRAPGGVAARSGVATREHAELTEPREHVEIAEHSAHSAVFYFEDRATRDIDLAARGRAPIHFPVVSPDESVTPSHDVARRNDLFLRGEPIGEISPMARK